MKKTSVKAPSKSPQPSTLSPWPTRWFRASPPTKCPSPSPNPAPALKPSPSATSRLVRIVLPLIWEYRIAIIFFLAWSTVFSLQESLTAYEKCRVLTATDLRDSKAPTFATYKVTERPFSGKPKLNLKGDPLAHSYPDTLREEVSKGPNFAGPTLLATIES